MIRLLVHSSFALLVVILASACAHDQLVKLQEDTLAPQKNYGRAVDRESSLLAVAPGSTQQQVIGQLGLPVMVHTEGRRLCSPWDSCTYPRTAFIYRSVEASTCTISFREGKVEKSTCEPFLKPVVLGPGDVDPHSGMTGDL